jgi:hypothetical protein
MGPGPTTLSVTSVRRDGWNLARTMSVESCRKFTAISSDLDGFDAQAASFKELKNVSSPV